MMQRKDILFLGFLLMCLVGCDDVKIPFIHSKKEGYIKYEVSFPFESGLMTQFYPKEMFYYFNEDQARITLSSSYGVVQTDFFIGQKDEFFSHYLKSFGDKKVIHMHHTNVHEWLKRYPDVEIKQSNEKKEIAGFLCQKAIADFVGDSLPDTDLYYTQEIHIKDKNWWNKYAGVDGVLLGYDVNLYGKRMRVKAVEVVFGPQDPVLFARPEGYEEVNMDQMESALRELSDSFEDSE
jgi:GLPGLI family protein